MAARATASQSPTLHMSEKKSLLKSSSVRGSLDFHGPEAASDSDNSLDSWPSIPSSELISSYLTI